MDYNWNLKRKYDLISKDTDTEDKNEKPQDEKKNDIKKNLVFDGLTETSLLYSVKNHIYFYSGVCKKSCMNLNIEIKKIANDLMTNRNNFSNLDQYIYIHINSFGGSVFSAMSTIDTIITCPIPIITIIEGAAASAATLISVVADYRVMTENSFMLIHQLSSQTWGKMNELEEEMVNLKKIMNKIKNIYKKNTKLKGSELDEILKHDLWWESPKCLETGLVDEVIKKNKFYKLNKQKLEFKC
ncbi:Clp protease [seawater metagenome]|uniref:Clp protease n=1 Tax=seawater metagenome TaxID=1561972 RepID=A0A5E8CJ68_9ZZZZ